MKYNPLTLALILCIPAARAMEISIYNLKTQEFDQDYHLVQQKTTIADLKGHLNLRSPNNQRITLFVVVSLDDGEFPGLVAKDFKNKDFVQQVLQKNGSNIVGFDY